jgi:uncharacterized protein YjbI with pentapeptide repeats
MARKLTIKDEDLGGSEFEHSNLSGAKFSDVNLCGSQFHNINFGDVQFSAAHLGGTLFKHIGPIPDKDGHLERQRPVIFEEGTLTHSVFRRMNMTDVEISDCDIDGLTIDGVLVTDLLKVWKKRFSQ